MAEWLRRLTRNQIPSGSAGSNPADCEVFKNKYFYNLYFCGNNVNKISCIYLQMVRYYYLPKELEVLKTFKLTLGMESSLQDLTALALEVGVLNASG